MLHDKLRVKYKIFLEYNYWIGLWQKYIILNPRVEYTLYLTQILNLK